MRGPGIPDWLERRHRTSSSSTRTIASSRGTRDPARASRRRPEARLLLRADEVLRRLGRRAALSPVRSVHTALPAHDRTLRAGPSRGSRGHGRFRPRLPRIRGLGALGGRVGPRLAGQAGRRGDGRVPAAFWLEARPGPARVPAGLSPAQGQARRSLPPARPLCVREQRSARSGRFLHRAYWGPRPMPAALEQGLYRLLWGRKSARTVR